MVMTAVAGIVVAVVVVMVMMMFFIERFFYNRKIRGIYEELYGCRHLQLVADIFDVFGLMFPFRFSIRFCTVPHVFQLFFYFIVPALCSRL